MIQCNVCNKILSPEQSLEDHLEIRHFPKKRIICPPIIKRNLQRPILKECPTPKKWLKKILMEAPRKSEISKSLHKCQFCNILLTSRSNLTRHYESFHSDKQCDKCGQKIKGRSNLVRHLRAFHDMKITLYDYIKDHEDLEPGEKCRALKRLDSRRFRAYNSKRKLKSKRCLNFTNNFKVHVEGFSKNVPNLQVSQPPKNLSFFERSFNKMFEAVHVPVQVLPLQVRIAPWEFYQTFA